MNKNYPVILCIGSDKILGDSIGPMVGDLLKTNYNIKCFVYGAIGNSVNGKNIDEYVDFISIVHPKCPIIAVDACMSNKKEIGSIAIMKNGINPKGALTKCNNSIGDIGILGIVDNIRKNPLSALLTVSHDKMIKISHKIAFVLYLALTS